MATLDSNIKSFLGPEFRANCKGRLCTWVWIMQGALDKRIEWNWSFGNVSKNRFFMCYAFIKNEFI